LKQIGCIILADVVFFPPEMWVGQPSDWARQNLRYTGYNLLEGEGRRIWDECLPLATLLMEQQAQPVSPLVQVPRHGEPVLVRPRLGQGAFRVAVTAPARLRANTPYPPWRPRTSSPSHWTAHTQ
jgi:putative restriction endonuclease